MPKDDSLIPGLIAAGVIVLVGRGVYKVVKSFGKHRNGDTIKSENISSSYVPYTSPDEPLEFCEKCGEVTTRFDSRNCNESHCKKCHAKQFNGYESCYCGHCLWCYGYAGGNECSSCSSDD